MRKEKDSPGVGAAFTKKAARTMMKKVMKCLMMLWWRECGVVIVGW